MGLGGSTNKNTSQNSSTSSYANMSMPVIPEAWQNQNSGLADTLGPAGVTAGQQISIAALQGLMPGMNAYTQAGYYSLQDLSKNIGGEWASPSPVNAQPLNAQTGASFMGAYKNPWDKDVIDASVADYNVNADRSLNAMRLGRDAAGAFGDRAALADAVFNADAARGLGSLVSGLRQTGFNTAAALGQQDANRDFSAQQANAANALAAGQFNTSLTNARQQFSVDQAMQGDQNRMQALRDMQNNILAQSGIQQGGVGNLLNLLGTGTATFGNQSNGNDASSSIATGKSSGKNGSISFSKPNFPFSK